ncbi:MAG: pyridoxal-phosphate dependent enzyme [Halioglobus sp.]|nr:pyridoxal-phosphate dependent enzyme [Halioglobus sp.]
MNATETVHLEDVQQAAERIAPWVHLTPVMSSELIDAEAGCELLFKCENLQKAGAFKARGAHNAVLALSQEELRRGVATHSSGNHAAALALAASRVQAPAYVVMPENAPAVKVAAVRAYGADITFCAPNLRAREEGLAAICARTGAHFIPPYDDARVIAGQGTCALELAQQLSRPPDVLVTPVGGGGLLSGCAVVARALWPDPRVIGAEPAGADDAQRGFRSGTRQTQAASQTIADGLRSTLGERNFAIIRDKVDDILTASDEAIVEAMRLVWTRMKLVIEPSAAVPLAVVLTHRELFAGQRVAVVVTGGNVDIDKLPW